MTDVVEEAAAGAPDDLGAKGPEGRAEVVQATGIEAEEGAKAGAEAQGL